MIVGAGGFGREVHDVVMALQAAGEPFEFVGFLDDVTPDADLLARRGGTHAGPLSELSRMGGCQYVVGIGSPVVRRSVVALASQHGLEAATLVHPSATLGGDVVLGPGTVVCSHASLTTNVRLGTHVHVNLNATIGHDAVLHGFVTVNPGANISGNVVLEEGVTMGTGSSIIQGCRVGARTTVGAGAAVVRDLPADIVAVGVPAEPRPIAP